uniref:Uncharacterized protein n=1 Tax=Phytophthora ramorum TaxID=164328 RepID=H3H1I4_PHYRM
MEASAAPEASLRNDEHFDHIRANLIRCEECNENFFFDFLRHPRYFVTHFKTCHLKNVLYRFNGCSEEENQRVRFGPRRKKDATAWFGQLKSTEKRMSSDMPHAFESSELGQRQALSHLRQFHDAAYNDVLRSQAQQAAADGSTSAGSVAIPSEKVAPATDQSRANARSSKKQSRDAERSRLRRMRATPEAKQAEAERSRRRREQMTPAQRHADVERRARKKRREDELSRSRLRHAEASPEAKEREMKRSRERRQKATDQQREREAQRSRTRRKNATDEQRLRERERCQRRYEARKQQKLLQSGAASGASSRCSPSATSTSDTMPPPSYSASDQTTPPPSSRVLPADLARRSLQLQQQQDGLGLQLQSLYDSCADRNYSQDALL